MAENKLILVDSTVLPEVFSRTLEAKRLLAAGEAKTPPTRQGLPDSRAARFINIKIVFTLTAKRLRGG